MRDHVNSSLLIWPCYSKPWLCANGYWWDLTTTKKRKERKKENVPPGGGSVLAPEHMSAARWMRACYFTSGANEWVVLYTGIAPHLHSASGRPSHAPLIWIFSILSYRNWSQSLWLGTFCRNQSRALKPEWMAVNVTDPAALPKPVDYYIKLWLVISVAPEGVSRTGSRGGPVNPTLLLSYNQMWDNLTIINPLKPVACNCPAKPNQTKPNENLQKFPKPSICTFSLVPFAAHLHFYRRRQNSIKGQAHRHLRINRFTSLIAW